MRPENGNVSSAGSTICTTWPCAPFAESCAIVCVHVARSGSRGRTAPRSRTAARARTSAAGSRARSGRARSTSAIFSTMLRLAVGRIRPGMPTRSPPSTSTSASANATTSARSSLVSQHERRGEHHRGRAVRPDPHRVRGFPFLLAHIEMVVARRAAPVDARGRLARHEAAELPEILARCRRGGGRAGRGSRSRRRGAPPGSAAAWWPTAHALRRSRAASPRPRLRGDRARRHRVIRCAP